MSTEPSLPKSAEAEHECKESSCKRCRGHKCEEKPKVPKQRQRLLPDKSEHLVLFKIKYPSLYEKLRSAIVQFRLLGEEKGIGRMRNNQEPMISEWNDLLENKFKEIRRRKRLDLAKYNVISSLDDLTMNDMRRNNLLSGEEKITTNYGTKTFAEVIESLKKSPFFINYMKRKEVEKEILEIGPDLFAQIELEVAEEVIGEYNDYLVQVKNLRKKYLQERSKKSSDKLRTESSRSYENGSFTDRSSLYRKSNDRPASLSRGKITYKKNTIDLYTGGPNIKKFEWKIYSYEDRICAAIKIQSHIRRYLARKHYIALKLNRLRHKNRSKSVNRPNRKTLSTLEDEKISKLEQLISFIKENDLKSIKKITHTFSIDALNSKDSRGNTALYYACQQGSLLMVSYLCTLGASINIKCEKNSTALHAAFMSDNADLVYYLINRGGDLTVFNDDFSTPLDYASGKLASLLGVNLKQPKGKIVDKGVIMKKFKHGALSYLRKHERSNTEIKKQEAIYTETSEEPEMLATFQVREIREYSPLYPTERSLSQISLISQGNFYEKGNTYSNMVKLYKRIKEDQCPPIKRICRTRSQILREERNKILMKEMPKIKLLS
ncbi:unnamed protein product [Blepharisma stoltei]|uniref:Uncharacterized protein n=1 Tax=Blepharisma stoltei TaxID=1481888 RepID=A0AAU9K8T3_9CILI|nr:unnamed protein product [Blepharisma stoltei]